MTRTILPSLALALALAPAAPAVAEDAPGGAAPTPGAITQQVGFDQKLGAQVPLDVTLVDEDGEPVRLSEFLGERPVILNLVYYRCPMLCNQVLQGLARSLKPIAMTPGQGFEIVTVSIDPKESPDLARRKKSAYIDFYGRPEAARGWHFLTCPDPAAIERLAASVGFRYVYNPKNGQYAHAAGIAVLTPEGAVSRYFFGIDHSPRDLKAALEAARGREVGSEVSNLLLLCYDYDPTTGRYTLTVMSVLRGLGLLTLAGMIALVAGLTLRERRRRAATPTAVPTTAAAHELRTDA
jgi:protein SCO1/2